MKPLSITLSIIVLCVAVAVGYFFYTYRHVNIPTTVPPGSVESENSAGGNDTTTASGPFTLPAGFAISTFADGLKNARVLAFDPTGTLLVSQPSEGKITALPNTDGDGKADRQITVVSGLNKPHGIAFRCLGDGSASDTTCTLYVAETNALSQFAYDPVAHTASGKKKLLDLPADGYNQHFTRTLLFMPSPNENTLLISVGSSCNVCHENDARRAKILSYDVTTGNATSASALGKSEVFAQGLRNAVFMTIHPVTGAIWATEMGRDGLGDTIPPDEVNIIEKGKNYGWPICYGANIHDDVFDKNVYIRNPCMEPFETPSHVDIEAHSAPLGLAFIPEEGWPEAQWHNLLVAYHGSWNRSVPTGYKIVRMQLDAQGRYSGTEDFITGWLRPNGTKIGRPVDIKVLPGGTMYISDDGAGVVYRVSRTNDKGE